MTNIISIRYWIAMVIWVALSLTLLFTTSPVSAQEYRAPQMLVHLEVRDSLVAPYLETIIVKKTINDIGSEKPVFMNVWIMADDRKGSKIYFNKDTRKFGLVKYEKGIKPFTSDAFVETNEMSKVFLARK